eukprot:scaffold140_cov247-Pinguiococcus_pyrenoidosus.AAC.6
MELDRLESGIHAQRSQHPCRALRPHDILTKVQRLQSAATQKAAAQRSNPRGADLAKRQGQRRERQRAGLFGDKATLPKQQRHCDPLCAIVANAKPSSAGIEAGLTRRVRRLLRAAVS